MDDAVLGLVWVTSVCILGHIASVLYFQKILRDEALTIDQKINEIDMGIASIDRDWETLVTQTKPNTASSMN